MSVSAYILNFKLLQGSGRHSGMRPLGRRPGIHFAIHSAARWILRCAIAHHSSRCARPGMTTNIRILATHYARGLQLQLPSKNRGSRECRVHAAPAVSRAIAHRERAHEHTGSAEAIRHSLRKGAYGRRKCRQINAVRLLCSHLCRDPMLIGVPKETWGHIDAHRAL